MKNQEVKETTENTENTEKGRGVAERAEKTAGQVQGLKHDITQALTSMAQGSTPGEPSPDRMPQRGPFGAEERTAKEAKPMGVTSIADAKAAVSDLKVVGNGDMFQLLCKASSERQGWMKSCKAMEIPGVGCVVQVTTHIKNGQGIWVDAVAEALTFVPHTSIAPDKDGGRKLVHTP